MSDDSRIEEIRQQVRELDRLEGKDTLPCRYCQERHAEGSAAFYACREQAVEALIADPTQLTFSVTDGQRAIIRAAYAALKDGPAYPEIEQVLTMLGQSDRPESEEDVQLRTVALIETWDGLVSDLPDLLKWKERKTPEIRFWFVRQKVLHVLRELRLPHRIPEVEDVRFCLGVSSAFVLEMLTPLAEVSNLQRKGYRIFDTRYGDVSHMLTVSLRQDVVWHPEPEGDKER